MVIMIIFQWNNLVDKITQALGNDSSIGGFLWKIDDGKCEMENGQKTEDFGTRILLILTGNAD